MPYAAQSDLAAAGPTGGQRRTTWLGLPVRAAAARAAAATAATTVLVLVTASLWGALPGTATAAPARTAGTPSATLLDAREAVRRGDRERLAAAVAALAAARDPLLPWAEYWALRQRLAEATDAEVQAFYGRWTGSYLEDRLRNDWLRELGRRRDFDALAREYPRFRMNDDREVRCWHLLTEHLAGREVRDQALTEWQAQRHADDGCQMLATALFDTGRIGAEQVWDKARRALVQHRPATARAAVGLMGSPSGNEVRRALDQPARYLASRPSRSARQGRDMQLRVLALMTLAQKDPEAAAEHLQAVSPGRRLAAWTWAYIGRQAAYQLQPQAAAHYQRALALVDDRAEALALDDETLAFGVRAALRNLGGDARWTLVRQLIGAMSETARGEAAWRYWDAHAQLGLARSGAAGSAEAARQSAHATLQQLARSPGATEFYGLLAADDLGIAPAWGGPLADAPTPAERDAVRHHPGLRRAWALTALGLRGEARREWNFALRDLDDRQRLAAAHEACQRQDWQLCINTAERVDSEIDMGLRYPRAHAGPIRAAARSQGLDPALVFGLIRQETRFMPQLRSHVGATGLMQVMPGTAKLVARRMGLKRCCSVAQIADRDFNLQLGTHYLNGVLERLDGSVAMAAAGYNAGPGRPARWRKGPELDAAVWVENIPFNETRGYVKAVLANAAVYAARERRHPPSLRPWLGRTIGPPADDEAPGGAAQAAR